MSISTRRFAIVRAKTRNPLPRRRMPIVDEWIGTSDARFWQRQDGYDFDWSSTDPWTRRIELT